MARRKILLLNERDPRNPLAGGAEVHIFEIFRRLVDAGHEVQLLAASFKGGATRETVDGIDVTRLANRYVYWGMIPFALRQRVKADRPDVVVDVLNKLPFLSPWLVPVPTFAIVHHLMGTTAFRQVSLPVATVTWASEKLIPSCYGRTPMFAISPSTRDDLIERGMAGDRIHVIPPGIDASRYTNPEGTTAREPLIAWVGRLEPYKFADHMIEAFAKIASDHPDAKLVVIGEGQVRPALTEQAERAGVGDRVTFTGFVSEEEKIEWLRRAAVVVNTSEKEGWGMTVIEGNACGAPSVSSNVPGLRDSVRDGDTGLLYDFGNVDELATKIARVLDDDDMRRGMVDRALGWAARFSWDGVASDVETLIEEAISPSGATARLASSPFSD